MLLNFKYRKFKNISFLIYKKIVLHSRNKIFYKDLGIPDTIDGRFDLIVLHFFFVHQALFNKGAIEQKVYDEVLNIMFKDFDSNLREIGVGDLSVGKKVYHMSEGVAGRVHAYNKCKNSKKLLIDKLRKNIYGVKKNINKKNLLIMLDYFLINLKTINKKKLLEIKENNDIFFDLKKIINNY